MATSKLNIARGKTLQLVIRWEAPPLISIPITGISADAGFPRLTVTGTALLHESVLRDYAARWPDLTPPTLAEVEAFCADVEIVNHAQEAPVWPTN